MLLDCHIYNTYRSEISVARTLIEVKVDKQKITTKTADYLQFPVL